MTDRRPGRDPSTEHLSDHGLLALTARGDREAFARLYDMDGGAAYALALRIVRDRELSADVVQDAFLTVWKQASKFDPARGQPSSWILTLTHHKAVDTVRREQRRRAEALDEARDQVRSAMAKLPDPHREVLELAYFAGYTQSELAERLALPIGTVKSRTFAAMTALRELLAQSGLNPEHEWNTSTS